mgnify:CR=1 FL=1
MGQPNFPVPSDLDTLLSLIDGDWSVIEDNGKVHGTFKVWDGLSQVEGNGNFEVFTGDQMVFTADSMEEVRVFLSACFLIAHRGADIEDIT